jgi:PAS domain S-box-containing protein
VGSVLADVAAQDFDIVVTLCNQALEVCPAFPGSPARIHWSLPDPAASQDDGPDGARAFDEVFDAIRARVEALAEHGSVQAIVQMRATFGALLDNLSDGVMAHDARRRVFFFNPAAQKITGYEYAEVVGRDCHEVFPGRFCGGICAFCDGEQDVAQEGRRLVSIRRKDGAAREVEMSVARLSSPRGGADGAVVILRDVTEVARLRRRLEGDAAFCGIVGRDPAMQKVFESVRDLADVDVPVLITGESGTGKDLVARALHSLSHRAERPFIPVNCGALPEGLLESELFGHVRGAFTGAIRDKKGHFEMADDGTLFLDEIAEISPAMQVKLLRVLQSRRFLRVGGEKMVDVNVRIVSATNKDLRALTRRGAFREDLYYRLAVIPISLPPLRERKGDIPLLVEYFLENMIAPEGREVRVAHRAMSALMEHRWPGNVRELRNAVQYALIQCKLGLAGVIDVDHLPEEVVAVARRTPESPGPGRKPKLDPGAVAEAMTRTGRNKAKAARLLGVSRTTLYRYLDAEWT